MLRRIGLATAVLLCAMACREAQKPRANLLRVADPSKASQLLEGFYDVEQGNARWTGRRFSVLLSMPPGSYRKSAKLWLRLYVPAQQIQEIGPMTLCADVDGHPLPGETFSKGGLFDFSRDVPAEWVDTNVVPVRFTFDRAVAPSAADHRELGAVVTDIGLLPK